METNELRQLAHKVNELHTALIGTESVPGAIPRYAEQLADHEVRLNRLEKWRNICVGGGLLIVFFLKYILVIVRPK